MKQTPHILQAAWGRLCRPFKLARAVGRTVRHLGGPISVARKALHLYRREGWSSVRRGLAIMRRTARAASYLSRTDYAAWLRQYDTLEDSARQALFAHAGALPARPLISVIMPVYNPPVAWLEAAIDSVLGQIYPNWELCIADDASTDPQVRDVLARYTGKDRRIKVVFRERNGHISAASNSALSLATGEWVALFDHDDMLSEQALLWVADAINRHPQAGLIYTDEDKISEAGVRSDPHFKPDWNYELFLSYNLICHLGVYKRALVQELGGFRVGLEGAQDYDLALRCIERLNPMQIVHVPRVLYHWRIHSASTAHSGDSKPYALLAGERALNEHFQRRGVRARATLLPRGQYLVRYDLPEQPPLVSLIIPTRNAQALVRQCIQSILTKTDYPNYEILLVDNGSDDPAALAYFAKLNRHERIRVLRDDSPFNYSALNNRAAKLARGELLGLVNNDIEVISPGWLTDMVAHALQPGVGVVGARLLYPNNLVQHAGVYLGVGGVAGHAHKYLPREEYGYFARAVLTQSLSAVTAACIVVRKSVYEEVGGLEEQWLQVAFNDVDFCLRVREAGYRNVYVAHAELYHHESVSRGAEDTAEKRARFQKEVEYMKERWQEFLRADPAYSPNLTLEFEDFSYAWPPRVSQLPEALP